MDSDDFDLSGDFRRAVLFDKIDPAVTLEQAQEAAGKVRGMTGGIKGLHAVVVCKIGGRYHVDLLVEDPLPEADAPPEYVDGVYVAVDRVTGLANLMRKPDPKP